MELLAPFCIAVVRQAAEAAATEPEPAKALTAAGWVFMLGSLGAVLTLVSFCYRRVLRTPKPIDPGPAAAP